MKIPKAIITNVNNKTVLDSWYVYMVECSDGTIYTGITNDVKERINKHNSGKGAKYTSGRTPVVLIAVWQYEFKSAAAKVEYAFKKLTKEQKLQLVLADKQNNRLIV